MCVHMCVYVRVCTCLYVFVCNLRCVNGRVGCSSLDVFIHSFTRSHSHTVCLCLYLCIYLFVFVYMFVYVHLGEYVVDLHVCAFVHTDT